MKLLPGLVLSLFALGASAQPTVPLITFGDQANPIQGDDDYTQVFFFKLPASSDGPLYLRIYDPDVGGALDEGFGEWDTQTRFTLFGGSGAYSDAGLRMPAPEAALLHSGVQLASESFGVDAFTDRRWHTFAEVAAAAGENVDGFVYFRLLVQGEAGNDGNVFDISLSLDAKLNRPPEGLEIFSFGPTISVPSIAARYGELRFEIPTDAEQLRIRNFDLEHSDTWLETSLSSDFPLPASGEGEWREGVVEIAPEHRGGPGAVIVRGYPDRYNNASVEVYTDAGHALPIRLPMLLHRANHRPEPTANIEFLSDCYSVVFDASATRDRDGDVLEYTWDFGDGEQAEGARVIHRYAQAGPYDYTLTVRDRSGRIADRTRVSFPLLLNQPPQAAAGPDLTAAPGQRLSFDGSASFDADGAIQRYHWDFGDGNYADGPTANNAYTQPGLYRVRLRVEDDSQSPCNAAVDTAEVWVNAAPLAEAGPDQVVAPEQAVQFSAGPSFDSDGEIAEYHWDFGDGSRGRGARTEHAYAQPGDYRVELKVFDNARVANSEAEDFLKIKVNQHPFAKPAVKTERVSAGEEAQFDGGASYDLDGRIIAYAWDFGDGGTGEGAQPRHAYAEPGTYEVTLEVQDESGTTADKHSEKLKVIVNFPPIAEAGKDQMVTHSVVSFDGSVSTDASDGEIVEYEWDFGDGRRAEGEQVSHVYRTPGVYRVTLTVTDDSGTSTKQASDTLVVTVNHKVVADAGPDRLTVPGEALQFDSSGSFDPDGQVTAYHWDFGDGRTSDEAAPAHTFAEPGIYTVRLSVSDDSGHEAAMGYDDAVVTVNAAPVVIAGPDVLAAPGDKIVLDAGASYDLDGKLTEYLWTLSDGSELKGARVRHQFAEPGIYTATLAVTDDSGASNARQEDSLTLRINHAPVAKAGDNVHTCDHTLNFDAGASADADGDPLRYIWSFGDGTPPVHGAQVVHTYAAGGTYPVLLRVDDGTGTANAQHSASLQVTVNQPPLADAGGQRTACAGELVLLDASKSRDPEGGRLKYSWDFGDDTQDEGMNPTKLYKNGGTYPVTLRVEDDSGLVCNTDRDRVLIQVAEAPVAEAGPDQEVCAHTLVQFDGGQSRDFDGVVNTYQWDFGDGFSGGGQTPSHMYEQPGDYRVALTITGDKIGECGNTNTDFLEVKVNAAPVAAFAAPAGAAQGAAVQFDAGASSAADGGTLSYAWDFGDGDSGEGMQVEHTYPEAGRYFVTLTVRGESDNDCNCASFKQLLVVNAPPQAVAKAAPKAAVGQVVHFDASESSDPDGGLTEYHWDFGDGAQGRGMEITHQYRAAGTYTATLRVTDDAGQADSSATQESTVQVNAAPEPHFELAQAVYCTGEDVVFDALASRDTDGRITAFRWDFGDGNQAEGAEATHRYTTPGSYRAMLHVEDDSETANAAAQTNRTVVVNQPPLAHGGPAREVCVGEKTPFEAARSQDFDGKLTAWQWDFGDGNRAEGMRAVHRYASGGTFSARLAVTDDSASACATTEQEIPVKVNRPPEAVIKLHADQVYSGGAHDAVLFDASASSDADGDALRYFWDFGDRTAAEGALVWHRFERPGNYRVRLRVVDDGSSVCREGRSELRVSVEGR